MQREQKINNTPRAIQPLPLTKLKTHEDNDSDLSPQSPLAFHLPGPKLLDRTRPNFRVSDQISLLTHSTKNRPFYKPAPQPVEIEYSFSSDKNGSPVAFLKHTPDQTRLQEPRVVERGY